MNHSISVEALKALDAIAKEGSFATAAITLHKVPSSLTYLIKKLEDDLGVELLDRSKKKAVLNETGLLVLKQGREVLDATERLLDSVREIESGWERKLKIVVDTLLSNEPLLDVIQKFKNKQRNIELTLCESSLNGVWETLINDSADIIIGGTGEPPIANIGTIKIGELECVLAIPKFHPLADKPDPINAEDLQPYPSVVVTDGATILPKRTIRVTNNKQVINVESIRGQIDIIRKGIAISFLPTHIARPLIESGEFVLKECALASCKQNVYIAWNLNKSGKALNWFVNELSQKSWL